MHPSPSSCRTYRPLLVPIALPINAPIAHYFYLSYFTSILRPPNVTISALRHAKATFYFAIFTSTTTSLSELVAEIIQKCTRKSLDVPIALFLYPSPSSYTHRPLLIPIALFFLYPSPSTCTYRPLLVPIAIYLYPSSSRCTHRSKKEVVPIALKL